MITLQCFCDKTFLIKKLIYYNQFKSRAIWTYLKIMVKKKAFPPLHNFTPATSLLMHANSGIAGEDS